MKNVPNILSIIRIIMVPIFLALFFFTSQIGAMYIFIFAFITDVADGYIARKYDAVSELGKVLDPFADKLMKLSALGALAISNMIPFWIFIVMLALDLGMIVVAGLLFRRKFVIPSNIVGKTGTFLLTVAILMSFFDTNGINLIVLYCGIATVVASIVVYGLNCINALYKKQKIS